MTKVQHSILKSNTGASLALYTWTAQPNPKAVIHINHGMAEHAARYDAFAQALNKAGYTAIAHDHRGHGLTKAPDAPMGMFAKADGSQKVLADIDAVNGHIRNAYPNVPILYFGHSMGAILGIHYTINNSEKLDASILWNSGVDGGPLLWIYSFLLGVERMFKGSDVPSQLARKLTFETWNKQFAPNRTESDWLTRDEAEVDKYIADPLCGFDACNGLWRDLIVSIKAGGDDHRFAKIRNNLPMHLLAGGQDPCSDKGNAVKRLSDRLKRAGIEDLTFVLNEDNRHEALNELSRDQVTSALITWLDERFAK